MPSLAANARGWTRYDWSSRGDEWSSDFGGTGALWAWVLQPRLGAVLPAGHVPEIAPGFGRVTQFLAPAYRRLTLVDLTERCIVACPRRQRPSSGRPPRAVRVHSVEQ